MLLLDFVASSEQTKTEIEAEEERQERYVANKVPEEETQECHAVRKEKTREAFYEGRRETEQDEPQHDQSK